MPLACPNSLFVGRRAPPWIQQYIASFILKIIVHIRFVGKHKFRYRISLFFNLTAAPYPTTTTKTTT